VQLRLQVPALGVGAGVVVPVVVVVGAAAVDTQVFRHSIACVSHVVWHVVVFRLMVGGVRGTGFVT
jgi:hypothetical protein